MVLWRKRMLEDLRLRNCPTIIQSCCVGSVRRFADHFGRARRGASGQRPNRARCAGASRDAARLKRRVTPRLLRHTLPRPRAGTRLAQESSRP